MTIATLALITCGCSITAKQITITVTNVRRITKMPTYEMTIQALSKGEAIITAEDETAAREELWEAYDLGHIIWGESTVVIIEVIETEEN